MKKTLNALTMFGFLALTNVAMAATAPGGSVDLPFVVPTLSTVVGFLIKFLFFFAGLAALLYLLLGAFSWVTSSGDKENVKKAQDKIQAAVVGLVIIVVVLVIIATLEQIVLKGSFCVGLTCDIGTFLPKLLN